MGLFYIPNIVSTIVFGLSTFILFYCFGETPIAPIVGTILGFIAYVIATEFLANRGE